MVKTILTSLIFVLAALPLVAKSPPADLYKGIVGETSDYREMIAVACVVRNRLDKGMSIGLIALARPDINRFVAKEDPKYVKLAKKAVDRVFNRNLPDITMGADHFEDIHYGCPRWAKGMDKVKKINNIVCYKSKEHD
jgi:hypothetical protein